MENIPISEIDFNNQTPEYIKEFWFDWFCSDKSLTTRGKRLMNIVKAIRNSARFDQTKTYVFFKNNCPFDGKTYDRVSVCDLESGDVLFAIETPGNRWGELHSWELYSVAAGFNAPVVTGSAKDVKDWFKQVVPRSSPSKIQNTWHN